MAAVTWCFHGLRHRSQNPDDLLLDQGAAGRLEENVVGGQAKFGHGLWLSLREAIRF